MEINIWDKRFLRLSKEISKWSKDPSKQVGCILTKNKRILSTGYNGFPMNYEDDFEKLKEREKKYPIIIHAEINAIITSALHGVRTDGSTAYLTMHPCSNCASALVNAGVKNIVCIYDEDAYSRWEGSFGIARDTFEKTGINVLEVKEDMIWE